MKNLTRRDLCASLPAFALFASALTEAQTPATSTPAPVKDPVAALTAGPETIPPHSRTFNYDELSTFQNPSGAITHTVMQGTLPTGEFFELHETTLQPGQMPHPPHRHRHTECILLREGTLDFLTGETWHHVTPGGVTYAASGELHGVKNNGTVPANYFVVAISRPVPM